MANKTHKWIVNISLVMTILFIFCADKFPENKNIFVWLAGLVVLGTTVSHFKIQFSKLKNK